MVKNLAPSDLTCSSTTGQAAEKTADPTFDFEGGAQLKESGDVRGNDGGAGFARFNFFGYAKAMPVAAVRRARISATVGNIQEDRSHCSQ